MESLYKNQITAPRTDNTGSQGYWVFFFFVHLPLIQHALKSMNCAEINAITSAISENLLIYVSISKKGSAVILLGKLGSWF